jgi:hypothetical protein
LSFVTESEKQRTELLKRNWNGEEAEEKAPAVLEINE